tara:strand:+ start:228 stop:563 length:336 start_codon:yes stop_codon:yes gene_type:complete
MKASKEFLTKAASLEMKRIIEEQDFDDMFVRIGMKGGGCSGYTYILDFCRDKDGFDLEYEDRGVNIIIDKKSDFFMKDTMIDFKDGLLDRGFKFINPAATTTCGCGVSFSL